jgi:hypothetical protein
LQNLEATAIKNPVLATIPVKLLAAYPSPARPLIESELTECLSGGFAILMAGDLKAKHKDWKSQLIKVRGSLLRDYANTNSLLIYGPDSPITTPYIHIEISDVLHVLVVKDFDLPVHLTVSSALSSDHLPVLIDTTCRSSFQNLQDGPTTCEWTGQHSRFALKTDSR